MPTSRKRSDQAPTRALARGLEILLAFAKKSQPLNLTEISSLLDMSPATAYRMLATLEEYGFVQRNEDTKQFAPGLAIMTLVPVLSDTLGLSERARRHVQRLAEDMDETTNLATLHGGDVLYLMSVPRASMLTVNNPTGTRVPAHCVGVGKMLLARLDELSARQLLGKEPYEARTPSTLTTWKALRKDLETTRERGYSISVEEYELGLCSVAAAVDLPLPMPIALNITCPTLRWSMDRVEEVFIPSLRHVATTIAEAHALQ